MTSPKPRRYLSHVVHFLTVLLPIVCHCVSQSLLLRSSSLSQLTQTFHHTAQSPAHCTHPSTGNHRIVDLQTKIQTYSTTKNKQTNKQTIHHQHHHYHNTPVLHVTVTSYKPLPLHNAYNKTYIISLHPIHIVHYIN